MTELRSGSRRHEIVEARRIVSWIAVRELGYSGADVARYLGVTTSCDNRSVSSGFVIPLKIGVFHKISAQMFCMPDNGNSDIIGANNRWAVAGNRNHYR